MPEILCPDCPLCGQPPYMVMGGGTQAFCFTDDCPVFTWDPSVSLDQNLLDMKPVQITDRSEEGKADD
jgi:hypothetical protein